MVYVPEFFTETNYPYACQNTLFSIGNSKLYILQENAGTCIMWKVVPGSWFSFDVHVLENMSRNDERKWIPHVMLVPRLALTILVSYK